MTCRGMPTCSLIHFWRFLLVFFLSSSFGASLCCATSPIRVGLYENAPKIFSENGQPSGIFVDILNHIASLENWNIEYVPGTWGENLDRLANGSIDLMPDLAITEERARLFSYPQVPALSSWFQVYAPQGNTIHSILDLNGKRILVLDRSVQQEAFQRLSKGFGLHSTVIGLPDYTTLFEKVQHGEADAAVTNSFYGTRHARQAGLTDTGILFEPSDLYFAAKKGDPRQLLPLLDKRLIELKSQPDSIYYSSIKKWTAERVPFALPLWIKLTILWVAAGMVATLIGAALLKHQVSQKTRELQALNSEMESRIHERTAELATVYQEQLAIFESASVGIVVLKNRIIIRCNHKMEEISGYAQGELIGKSTRIWYPDEETFIQRGNDVYQQLAKGAIYERSQPIGRKDGTQFWARLRLQAIDRDDPFKGAVGILEDISLEREAAEKLQLATQIALEADRIKSSFLATMSHELRTPLNSIIGFTGILLQELAGPLNNEQYKQLHMVQNSSRHLLSLINDVLDISKIEAGQLSLSITTFDINASIEKTVKSVTPLAEDKQLELTLTLPKKHESIATDARRFEQILLNLLNNAIKFTDTGGITVACTAGDSMFHITVTDTGPGISSEGIAKLFLPFSQVDSGLARKHEGTGLGLSICKRLIDKMGGSITVSSEVGKGSTFSIHIPKVDGDAA